MFVGFFEIGGQFYAPLLVRDTGLSPVDADSPPIYRIYGPTGVLSGVTGACTFLDTGTITAATNASPVVYTCPNHGLASGFVVSVTGVLGNTGANASGICTVIDANTFSLDGSAGTGTYTSGGNWHMTGLYTYTFPVATASGFEVGTLYVTVLEGTSGGILFSYTQTWQVN
jgi:hypothetical protein